MLGSWVLWARAGRGGGAVVAVRDCAATLTTELPRHAPRVRLRAVATCPTTGALCLLLDGADELLLLAPAPARAGSNTPGNLLPW